MSKVSEWLKDKEYRIENSCGCKACPVDVVEINELIELVRQEERERIQQERLVLRDSSGKEVSYGWDDIPTGDYTISVEKTK